MQLKDKIAIVTGATSGIGRATVELFLAEGASVLAVGRDQAALDDLSSGAAADRLAICRADVTDADAPSRIVAAAIDAFGALDVLVNAAGIIGFGTLDSTTDEAWDEQVDVNLRAPFRMMREAVSHLEPRRGAIVNVSSVTGLRAFPGILAYCASKAGADHLTRCAALELAPRGVRVNGVNPGVVVTQLHKRAGMTDEGYAAFIERCAETHPLGRPGQPEEVARLILFLASDSSGWITGETLAIDGGRHLTCAR